MPAFAIQVLDHQQIPLMRELLAMFGTVFEEVETYTARQPDDGYLDHLLSQDHFLALAATSTEGRVIGGLAAYVLHKFEQARSEVYIYDLAVRADQRRQGVATALIAELRRLARERGAYVVFVQADKGDDPAIALYNKLGVQEDVLHFDIQP